MKGIKIGDKPDKGGWFPVYLNGRYIGEITLFEGRKGSMIFSGVTDAVSIYDNCNCIKLTTAAEELAKRFVRELRENLEHAQSEFTKYIGK